MSEEEKQAIIHLLDKQARYEYARKNNISFSDEDYEAYIIRQSMIAKDKEIERLNNIINVLEKHLQNEIHNGRSEDNVWLMGCYDEDREILDKLHELKGEINNENKI